MLSVDKNVEKSIKVKFDEINEPEMEHVKQQSAQHYMSVDDVAKKLGFSTNVISRITGTIYLLLSHSKKAKKSRKKKEVKPARVQKKVNVGLCLKFNKRKEEIFGWSKSVDDEWFFSSDTIEVLEKYITEFLSKHQNSYEFQDLIVFGEDGLNETRSFTSLWRVFPA